jgi:hypothetical protein
MKAPANECPVRLVPATNGEKGIFILAPMVGKKHNKEEEAAAETDAKSNDQRLLYAFRGVYVSGGLSRDLRLSLCALDGIRQCHIRKSPR